MSRRDFNIISKHSLQDSQPNNVIRVMHIYSTEVKTWMDLSTKPHIYCKLEKKKKKKKKKKERKKERRRRRRRRKRHEKES
jgi:cytochrome b subunit of formate dehydrogenase